jgi:hypothetical protein
MGIRALVTEVMDPLRSLSNIIVADLGIRIGAVGVGWRSMAVNSILSSSMSYVLQSSFEMAVVVIRYLLLLSAHHPLSKYKGALSIHTLSALAELSGTR